jgi:hypothetical protein
LLVSSQTGQMLVKRSRTLVKRLAGFQSDRSNAGQTQPSNGQTPCLFPVILVKRCSNVAKHWSNALLISSQTGQSLVKRSQTGQTPCKLPVRLVKLRPTLSCRLAFWLTDNWSNVPGSCYDRSNTGQTCPESWETCRAGQRQPNTGQT